MGEQKPPANNTSNEIDLGQLFELIKKGFRSLFKRVLRVFLYLKKNSFKLIGLIAVGVAIGFVMNTFVPKKLKTELIVKPNFESKDYLYAAIDEVSSNIRVKDSAFFRALDIDVENLAGFSIAIEAVQEQEVDLDMIEQNTKYLETLQNYKNSEFVLDVVKSEILQKNTPIHRITFTYKNGTKGHENSKKIMTHINSNSYFNQLQKVAAQNAQTRIEKNEALLLQIDNLISNYSKNITDRENEALKSEGMVLFDNENTLNIPRLLDQKNLLIREIEEKQLQLIEQSEAIRILNFGNTQAVQKPLYGKNLILFPLILLGAFFLVSLLSYMNRKSKELI